MELDYRNGNTWGHALHGSTMCEVRAEKFRDRLRDRLQKAYRASVLIHSRRYPRKGDSLLWKASAGHEVRVTVYDVEWCAGTDDMYRVFFRRTPEKAE